jgi:predicted ribosome quality control (RQC) complex YloA/Tae2 family protein
MKDIIINDIKYIIGQNAQDNFDLIKSAQIDWFWFHLEKFPSCHVLICKNEITNDEILNAGNLVKEHSKYKFKNIGINYCKISNLKLENKIGSVSFISNKKVSKINL